MRIVIRQGLDEKAEPEEFTCDLYPLVDSVECIHLDNDGLPTKGTKIREGMIIVGKRGKGGEFNAQHMPNSLELHALSRTELATKYPNYWTNTSLYATKEMEGTVENAYFESIDNSLCAVVEIERIDFPAPA